MRLWKRIKHFFSVKERIVSFEIDYKFKTESEMTLGVESVRVNIDKNEAIKMGYIDSGDWKYFSLIEKVKKDISDKVNANAEKLLKDVRSKEKIFQNNAGVWISGKHIVAVFWSVGDLKSEPLTFEEYLEYLEIENGRKKRV